MLDVASSDDANDWPWGNVLLRQGGSKKGARERETDSYVSTKQWQKKKKKRETGRMLCKYHITHKYH